jgi:hypothetical protein
MNENNIFFPCREIDNQDMECFVGPPVIVSRRIRHIQTDNRSSLSACPYNEGCDSCDSCDSCDKCGYDCSND